MNWRLRVPSAIYRLAVTKAGSDSELARLVVAYLERYLTDQTDAQQTGAIGGHTRAANLSPERRIEIATLASRSRRIFKDKQPDAPPEPQTSEPHTDEPQREEPHTHDHDQRRDPRDSR